ncbi:MAG: sugar ABC transporter permease [Lachnospiraceae bacterium]|jgi:multiple sugar transport system permease protein|nr:sugar ABC transporter permease [Lachnospiraceae bacterium]
MVKKRSIWPYLLVAPAVFIILCVVFVPVANAIIMSFQNYDLRRPKDIAFNGVANYIEALGDSKFQSSFFKTIIWVVAGVGFQFLFGFILAILLNQEFKGRGAIRAISMIPWVTPGVLIGLMWRWIYDGNQGVLNDILMKLHLISDKVPFLSQDGTAFPSVILTIIWQGIPFFALMLLAALQGVSTDMYEAADIDGATAIQKLAYITIPSIKNTIFVTALLRVIWVANSVDVIFNMTEGRFGTLTMSVYVYQKGNALDLGYASAMALILALCLLVVAIPYLRMNFKEEG